MKTIILNPTRARCHGNVINTGDHLEDYIHRRSNLINGEDIINNIPTPTFTMEYNYYEVGFHYNKATRELYIKVFEDFTNQIVEYFKVTNNNTLELKDTQASPFKMFGFDNKGQYGNMFNLFLTDEAEPPEPEYEPGFHYHSSKEELYINLYESEPNEKIEYFGITDNDLKLDATVASQIKGFGYDNKQQYLNHLNLYMTYDEPPEVNNISSFAVNESKEYLTVATSLNEVDDIINSVINKIYVDENNTDLILDTSNNLISFSLEKVDGEHNLIIKSDIQ